MGNRNIALKIEDIALYYGGVKAVDGVTFDVADGSIHGLIGPNGAGKSTLIDAITGRRKVVRGAVYLHGRNITELGIIDRRRTGLARSFQRTSIFPDISVWDQISLAAYKVAADDPEQDALGIIKQLDLEDVMDQKGGTLGYGQQRRLDLALALVGRPSVLLLDEPMAGLSSHESEELARHLQELVRLWRVSILLIEHDTDIIFGISDSVTVLELGRVIASGGPEEIRAHPRVREAYLGSAA